MGSHLRSAVAGVMLVMGPLFFVLGLVGPNILLILLGAVLTIAACVQLINPR